MPLKEVLLHFFCTLTNQFFFKLCRSNKKWPVGLFSLCQTKSKHCWLFVTDDFLSGFPHIWTRPPKHPEAKCRAQMHFLRADTNAHNKTVKHMTVRTHVHSGDFYFGSAPIFKATLIELVSPEASPLKGPLTVRLLGPIQSKKKKK